MHSWMKHWEGVNTKVSKHNDRLNNFICGISWSLSFFLILLGRLVIKYYIYFSSITVSKPYSCGRLSRSGVVGEWSRCQGAEAEQGQCMGHLNSWFKNLFILFHLSTYHQPQINWEKGRLKGWKTSAFLYWGNTSTLLPLRNRMWYRIKALREKEVDPEAKNSQLYKSPKSKVYN